MNNEVVVVKWLAYVRFGSVGRSESVPNPLITERASNVEARRKEEPAALMECASTGGMVAWRSTL